MYALPSGTLLREWPERENLASAGPVGPAFAGRVLTRLSTSVANAGRLKPTIAAQRPAQVGLHTGQLAVGGLVAARPQRPH